MITAPGLASQCRFTMLVMRNMMARWNEAMCRIGLRCYEMPDMSEDEVGGKLTDEGSLCSFRDG